MARIGGAPGCPWYPAGHPSQTSQSLGSMCKVMLSQCLLPLQSTPATKQTMAQQRSPSQASSSPCPVDGASRRAPKRCPSGTRDGDYQYGVQTAGMWGSVVSHLPASWS